MHTDAGGGRDSPEDVIDHVHACASADVVAITDRDTIAGALRAATHALRRGYATPQIVIGEEVSTLDGHLVGLFLRERVPPGLTGEDTVRLIHEQGGLAVAIHPFWRHLPVQERAPRSLGELSPLISVDAVEVINASPTPRMWLANRRAAEANRSWRLAAVGGSDARVKQAVGWAATLFAGRGTADLRRSIVRGACSARGSFPSAPALGAHGRWAMTAGRRPRGGYLLLG